MKINSFFRSVIIAVTLGFISHSPLEARIVDWVKAPFKWVGKKIYEPITSWGSTEVVHNLQEWEAFRASRRVPDALVAANAGLQDEQAKGINGKWYNGWIWNPVYFNFSENQLENLPKEFAIFEELSILILNHNKLESLPKDFGSLKALKILDLSDNKLQALPDSFYKLQNLKALNIAHNRFKSLPRDFGKLNSLEVLDLKENELHELISQETEAFPIEYQSTNTTAAIKVSRRTLEPILPNLEKLNLSSNRFETFPSDISFGKKLSIVDLSKNQLTEFPEIFLKIESLQVLALSGNPITRFSKEFVNDIIGGKCAIEIGIFQWDKQFEQKWGCTIWLDIEAGKHLVEEFNAEISTREEKLRSTRTIKNQEAVLEAKKSRGLIERQLAKKIAEHEGRNDKELEACFQRAVKFSQQEFWIDTREACEKFLKSGNKNHPRWLSASALYMEVLDRIGMDEEAKEAAKEIIKQIPQDDSDLLHKEIRRKAMFLLHFKKAKEAYPAKGKASLEEAQEKCQQFMLNLPDKDIHLMEALDLYYDLLTLLEEEKTCGQPESVGKEKMNVLYRRAQEYNKVKDWNKGISDCEEFLGLFSLLNTTLDPAKDTRFIPIKRLLIEMYSETGKWDKVIHLCDELLPLLPEPEPVYLERRGREITRTKPTKPELQYPEMHYEIKQLREKAERAINGN